MKFISGMIIGEINGIALGIAGTVVAIAVCAMVDKPEKDKPYQRYTKPRYHDYFVKNGEKDD